MTEVNPSRYVAQRENTHAFGEKFVEEFRRHIPFPTDDVPAKLWHYTTRSGLIGILDSRELRATDLRFLNDTQERRYALRVYRDLLSRRLKNEREMAARVLLLAARSNTDSRLFAGAAYTFSFSEDGDDLSQWRAYTQARSAYSLAFDSRSIARLTSTAHVFGPFRCRYKRPEQEAFSEEVMSRSLLLDVERHFDRLDAATLAAARVLFTNMLVSITGMVLKHPRFEAEHEWRLVLITRPEATLGFRDGRTMLTPYCALGPVSSVSDLGIREIVIGPTPHARNEKIAVGALLEQRGCKEVKVRASRIPFRNW